MKKLVSIMIATGLYFVPTKNDEGQPTYTLDPCAFSSSLLIAGADHQRRPIDVFVHYEGKRADDIGASRYAVRHMIANEVRRTFQASLDGC
mgnify:CR=1